MEDLIESQKEEIENSEPVKRGRGRPKGSLGKNNKLYHEDEMRRFVNGMVVRDKNPMSKEENARYTANAMEVANLPTINMMDVNQVKERCNQYLEICQRNDLKPNMAGLGLALHTDRKDLLRICNGQHKCPQEVVDVLKQMRRILNDLIENYQYDNKGNAVSMIFLSKNNFGYVDQTETVVSTTDQFGAVQDATEIRNKYLENMVDDSIEN